MTLQIANDNDNTFVYMSDTYLPILLCCCLLKHNIQLRR